MLRADAVFSPAVATGNSSSGSANSGSNRNSYLGFRRIESPLTPRPMPNRTRVEGSGVASKRSRRHPPPPSTTSDNTPNPPDHLCQFLNPDASSTAGLPPGAFGFTGIVRRKCEPLRRDKIPQAQR